MAGKDWRGTNVGDVRERIVQSNDVAGIVFDVMQEKTPYVFPLLDLRYGIADALWDAGYRKVEN